MKNKLKSEELNNEKEKLIVELDKQQRELLSDILRIINNREKKGRYDIFKKIEISEQVKKARELKQEIFNLKKEISQLEKRRNSLKEEINNAYQTLKEKGILKSQIKKLVDKKKSLIRNYFFKGFKKGLKAKDKDFNSNEEYLSFLDEEFEEKVEM